MVLIDVSKIDGTRCYCDNDAASEIRKILADIPLSGSHYLGSGDYHYITLFQLEKIAEPFCLVLFDNHTDQQEGAFSADILSCGNWVLSARKLPMMKSLAYISDASWKGTIDSDLPVYLSIDLDVLSVEYAHTNWNQGTMNTDELCAILSNIVRGRRVIGLDICGAPEGDGPSQLNQKAINQISNTALR